MKINMMMTMRTIMKTMTMISITLHTPCCCPLECSDNDDDNKDNDDDNDDDDDSHPAPCNNRGSSVATLASPGISQMRLLCLTDNTSHTAQRRFFRIYSASQTTTQLLMCDNHTRKIKYSLLHGLHLQCIFVMAKSYKKQILPFFM